MKRSLVTATVVVVLVVAAAAAAVPTLIAPQLAKSEITEQIAAWVGASVAIGSEPVVRIRSSVVVELKNVSIAATPDAAGVPTITIPALEASIEILPLLLGRTEIESLTLLHPTIDLLATEVGSGNLPAGCAGTVAWLRSMSSDLGSMGRGDITLRDGTITGLDCQGNRVRSITKANLRFVWRDAASFARLAGTFHWQDNLVEIDAEVDDLREAFGETGSPARMDIAVETADRAFVERFGISTRPGSNFGPLAINGKIKADRNSVTLSEATFAFPENEGEGSLTLAFGGGRPVLGGSIDFRKLDLGRYARQFLRIRPSELLALPLSFSWLGDADVDLTAHVHEADLGSIRFAEASLQLVANAERLMVALNTAESGGDHLKGTVTTPKAGDGIAVQLSGSLGGVAIADVGEAIWDARVNRLVGTSRPPAGTAGVQFDLSAHGGTLGELIRSLDGWTIATVENGSIDGVDIVSTLERLSDGNTVIAEGNAPFIPVPGQTRFTWLTAHMNFGAEVAQAERIRLIGDQFDVAVSGRGDLNNGELEAQGVASLFTSASRFSRLRPVVQLPFGVGGTIRQPVSVPGIPHSQHAACHATSPLARIWCGTLRNTQHGANVGPH